MTERDGHRVSLWQDGVNYQPINEAELSAFYDVVIVGGGMTGIVTGFILQQRGIKCLIVEAHNLGFGTTGGTTAHLNTLLDTPYTTITKNFDSKTSALLASAAAGAIRFIGEQVDKYAIRCEFAKTPAYLFSENKSETDTLIDIFDATKEAGLPVALSNELPIPVEFEKCMRVDDQARFHPLTYLLALAGEFEKAGGQIITGCALETADTDGDDVLITTTRGLIRSKKIVYATHIPPGINLLHLRCAPWRSYALAATLTNGQYPEGLIYDSKDPYHYYRTQVIDGQKYLIAGGCDHKTGDHENTQNQFRQLRAHVEEIFNVEEITHQWSSQYFESADGLPYIGIYPGHSDNFYVATGYGGNGMIYSHIAAQEIASLILKGESLFNNIFSPSRVKPIAGFNNFIDHNKDVVKHFIGKFLGAEELEGLVSLAPGEGRVVRIEGHHVAVSKDDHGKLYAVSSICTHMKCSVAWNSGEQSWDCPCHGARYSPSGEVLTGPATRNLECIELTKLMGVAKS